MFITFHNVEITIEAPTAKEAYTQLCNLLADKGTGTGAQKSEWQTDTYTACTSGGFGTPDNEERSTTDFFMKLGEGKKE